MAYIEQLENSNTKEKVYPVTVAKAVFTGEGDRLDRSLEKIETDVKVNSGRIDQFTKLPAGSTSGNAELADIRVMRDGTTADSAGAAIREQMNKVVAEKSEANGLTMVAYEASGEGDEIEVPSMEEFNELKSDLSNLENVLTDEDIVEYKTIPGEVDNYFYGFKNVVTLPSGLLKTITLHTIGKSTEKYFCALYDKNNTLIVTREVNGTRTDGVFEDIVFNCDVDITDGENMIIEISNPIESVSCRQNATSNTDICTATSSNPNKYRNRSNGPYWNVDPYNAYYMDLSFAFAEKEIKNLNYNIDFDLGLFDKVGAGGDSFIYGSCGNSNGEYISLNSSWFEQLMRRNGVRYYKNYSKGGMTTRSWIAYSGGLPKALTEDACDCYLLGFGINDSTELGLDYVGTVSDIKADYTQNGDTFYGNYGKIISQLKEHSPSTKIFLFPIWYNNNHQYKTEYNNAIKNIADKFNFAYYINIFEDDFFNTDIYKTMPNSHPSVLSYNGMSHAIERLINKKIKDNWNDFVYSIVG